MKYDSPENIYDETQIRKRAKIRSAIHDFCFTERAGCGCAGCPLEKINICSFDIMRGVEMKKLKEAMQIIKEAKQDVHV